MLAPKRVLHRKVQRGSMKGKAKGNTELNFGSWGIQALEAHWITNRQIEASRVAITRRMRRGGKVWITIFPDKPITKKPAETPRGRRQGSPSSRAAQAADQDQDRQPRRPGTGGVGKHEVQGNSGTQRR